GPAAQASRRRRPGEGPVGGLMGRVLRVPMVYSRAGATIDKGLGPGGGPAAEGAMTNGESECDRLTAGPPQEGAVPAAGAGPKRPRRRGWRRTMLEVAGLLGVAAAVSGVALYALTSHQGRRMLAGLGVHLDAPPWAGADVKPRFSSDAGRI